jgi:YggT family protein
MIYSPFQNAGVFLVKTVFSIYICVVLIRFILQYIRADFYNPISQAIIKITNPVVIPLRKFIPSFRSLDLSTLFLAIFLQFVQIFLLTLIAGKLLSFSGIYQILGILVIIAGELASQIIQLYTFFVFITVILSWMPGAGYNPLATLLIQLTDPLLRPARRIIPAVGGLDFSPMVVLIALQLASYLIADPILMFGNILYAS